MRAKLTPWFPAYIKPVHIGVYKTRGYAMLTTFAKWNGFQWYVDAFNMNDAQTRTAPSMIQDRQWRGLASKPK